MEYATLSLSELKVLAAQNNVTPIGDKRSKQSWIDGLEIAQRRAAFVEPTTDAEFEAAMSEYEALSEFGETDIWGDDSDITDSTDDSDSVLEQTVESVPIDSEPAPVFTEVLNSKSDKPGAVSVFALLLCAIIATVQAVLFIGCAIVTVAIHIRTLFGTYNPDYDLLGQLQDMARQRKLIGLA